MKKARTELPEGPGQYLLHQQHGDKIQQQGCQHFVHVPAQVDRSGEARPHRSGGSRTQQRRRDGKRCSEGKGKRSRRRSDAADRDLALGADIDDAGAKTQSDAAAGEQIGRGAVQGRTDLMRRSDGPYRHRAKCLQWIMARQGDERSGAQYRQEYSEQYPSGQSLAQLQAEGSSLERRDRQR